MSEFFRVFARRISAVTGEAYTFLAAVLIVVVWLLTGPIFHYSDTWQLVINTGTTIITFLMVFLVQNTQNRDNQAVQLKLDELLRSIRSARNSFVDIENLRDEELEVLAAEFSALHERAQREKDNRAKRRS